MTTRIAALLALSLFAAAPAIAKPPATAAKQPTKQATKAATVAATVPAGWQQAVSEKGSYSLVYPGVPSEQKLTAADGTFLATMFVLEIEGGDVAYMSSYSDLPPERMAVGADTILTEARDGALTSAKGRLESETTISLDGFPGRELVIVTAHPTTPVDANGRPNEMKSFVRVFLVNGRIYQAMGVMPKTKVNEKQVRTFLDSFRLTTAK